MTCRCGHNAAMHEHYRDGTDCSVCDCPTYRRPAPENLVWPWLRSHLFVDVMAELASIKSIALSTRTTVQEMTMASDRELLTTIHAAVTALTDPVHELVADRDRWRTRALTAEGALADDEADDTAAAQPIKDALDALTSKLDSVAASAPTPIEEVPEAVADAPNPDAQA